MIKSLLLYQLSYAGIWVILRYPRIDSRTKNTIDTSVKLLTKKVQKKAGLPPLNNKR